ncbi:unnamed protein product [Lampetra fluviatilis]
MMKLKQLKFKKLPSPSRPSRTLRKHVVIATSPGMSQREGRDHAPFSHALRVTCQCATTPPAAAPRPSSLGDLHPQLLLPLPVGANGGDGGKNLNPVCASSWSTQPEDAETGLCVRRGERGRRRGQYGKEESGSREGENIRREPEEIERLEESENREEATLGSGGEVAPFATWTETYAHRRPAVCVGVPGLAECGGASRVCGAHVASEWLAGCAGAHGPAVWLAAYAGGAHGGSRAAAVWARATRSVRGAHGRGGAGPDEDERGASQEPK